MSVFEQRVAKGADFGVLEAFGAVTPQQAIGVGDAAVSLRDTQHGIHTISLAKAHEGMKRIEYNIKHCRI